MSNDNFDNNGFVTSFGRYITGGIDIGYMLNNNADLFGGIAIGNYTYRLTSRPGYTTFYNNINEGFVQIPFYLRMHTGIPRHLGFFMNVGFMVEILANVYEQGENAGTTTKSVSLKYYNSTNVSPFLYLGLHVPCGRRVFLNIRPDIHYHLANDFKSTRQGHLWQFGGKMGCGIRITPDTKPQKVAPRS